MKRFYNEALNSLKDSGKLEIADDIDGYVKYLEHEKSVLIAELGRVNTPASKHVLARMGFKQH